MDLEVKRVDWLRRMIPSDTEISRYRYRLTLL